MLITTKLILDSMTGKVLDWRGHEYVGPVEEAKKGSDSAKQAAQGQAAVAGSAQDLSKSNQATQTGARQTVDPFAKSLIPGSNGSLSPYAQAQYQQAKSQNAMDAQNQRQVGAKAMGLRGMNNSPGALSSVLNTAGQNQNMADTRAYQNAQQATLGQGLDAMGYYTNQQQIYDPNKPLQTATGAYSGEANAAQVMNQSPTLAGDIGMGLMGLGSTAGSLMTGMGSMGYKPFAG